MSVQVSRLVRITLLERFVSSWQSLLDTACQEYGVKSYTLNFELRDDAPQNFYEGNRSLDELTSYLEPDFPALTMWTGEGGQYGPGVREMCTVFSGMVTAHWRYFLAVKGTRSAGLVDLREATEAAMIEILNPEFGVIGYKGDLAWQPLGEQVWVDQDANHVGFLQTVEFVASFEVTAV